MKTHILQLILGTYAAAYGLSGTITVGDGTVQTITKTIYHTTMQRHESVHARRRETVPFLTMASVFSWSGPGKRSLRNNEAGAAQLAKTTQTPPFLESGHIRQHDEVPRSIMVNVFTWPSEGFKSNPNIEANGIEHVNVMITPTPQNAGLDPRIIKGHKPTVSQISVTRAHFLAKKPTSRFTLCITVGPSSSRNGRKTDLFNLKLTLPRSPGYLSVFISDGLATYFCQDIPGETREDESDSKLDGSRKFYDLELGIGVGLTKIPVREDHAVKFCRAFKGGYKGQQTPDKEETSAEKTGAPKSKPKITAAAATSRISTSSEASTTPAADNKLSPVKSATETTNLANAKAKSTATATTKDESERLKAPGTTSTKAKSLPTESSIEGLTMSQARAKTTAAVSTSDESDPESSKPTINSSTKAKSSHFESPSVDVDQTKAKAVATETISSGNIPGIPKATKPTPTKTKSSYIDHVTEALTTKKATAEPIVTSFPNSKSDVPVSDLKSTTSTEAKTQDATKSTKSVQTGTNLLMSKLLDGETPIATRTRRSSSQTSNLAPQDITSSDKAVPPVLTKQHTNPTPIEPLQFEGEIEAAPGRGGRPSTSAKLSDPKTNSALISDSETPSSIVKTLRSKATANVKSVPSTQAMKEGSQPIETSPKPTKSISRTMDNPSKTTDPASIHAQRESPLLTVSSINSWYDSMNGYLRTVNHVEEDTPLATNVPITYPTATLRTSTVSMTTMSSVKRRDEEPLLTIASMNSWYYSINDYLKTATANDAATKAMPAHPSSNAAVKRANIFGLWGRAKPVRTPPAVVVRREVDQAEADGENDSNTEKVEELEVVDTADEQVDVAEEEQMPPLAEPPAEDGEGVVEEDTEDVAEPEVTPEEETSVPEADPPAEDAASSPEEIETEASKPEAPAEENLPPLELLSTEQPTPTPTPDTESGDTEDTQIEPTTVLDATATKEPEPTATDGEEEVLAASIGEPDAEIDAEGKAEEKTDAQSNETATGFETTTATQPTSSKTLIWDPSCTASAPLDPSSAPPASPDDADDTSFPPSASPNPNSPHSSHLPDKPKTKGCWTLAALNSTSNATSHDSLSIAWGTIKEKELVWTVMLGWTMFGLEIFMGGWEFMRGVRGDPEVGRRIVGLWVRP